MTLSRSGLPDLRLAAAVVGARATARLSRELRLGGGTTVPGRVAERVDPRALEKLTRRLTQGVVAVAGTNGKTTTARILAEVLSAAGHRVVHNRAGANLLGGLVAALAVRSPASGRPHEAIAVLETDEAALPAAVSRGVPSVVVLTNLFRDQLDRFAELDDLTARWRTALEGLPASSTVVVNADDPSLVALTESVSARRVFFGIDESIYELASLPHAAEVLRCGRCGERLSYAQIFVGHLGSWECGRCGRRRPALDAAAGPVELWSQQFQSAKVVAFGDVIRVEAALPGLYNTYNVLAALTAALVLGVPSAVARRGIADYRGAFGRGERLHYRGRTVTTMLVKNPVGCDEVLRALGEADRGVSGPILFALNDEAADGRDVSWIWDVDFERVAGWGVDVSCAGTRAADVRNRLYYAGVPSERLRLMDGDLGAAFEAFVDSVPPGRSGYVLATYSALLSLRASLSRRHELAAFWAE